MAFYTQNVKTEIFNAVFDQSKYRSEFRLTNDKLYLSNMRILNLGLTALTLGADGRYNLVNGVGSIIKNVYLYSGSVILDKVINFADYNAFQAYNKSNQHNTDIAKILTRNGLGFVYEKERSAEDAVSNPITIKENFPNAPHKPEDLEDETPLGFLSLTQIFPILKGSSGLQFLHTGLFKDLRVVIEYNVIGSIVEDDSVLKNTALPILVADCVEDPAIAEKWLGSFKQQSWVSNELEIVSVPVPSVTELAAGIQSLRLRLTGSLGKTVNYMLMQKKGTTSVSALYGNHGSEAMRSELIQIFCNGSAVLPEQGVSSSAQKLALLHDTFGVCNSHTTSNELSLFERNEYIDAASDRSGRLDYFGCIINKQVNALDLAYQRAVTANEAVEARYNQGLTLNIFYGVLKAVVKNAKGGFEIVYL